MAIRINRSVALLALAVLSLAIQTGAVNAAQTIPSLDTATVPLLRELRGKVVLLDFWASWCAPCRASFPWMNDLQRQHANDGLVVIGVNVDMQPELAQAFLRDTPAVFRIANDASGDLATRFDLQAMPTSFLIDRQGRIRHRHSGFRNEQRAAREQQVLALLKEKA